jgi:hypothetical protein
LADIPNFIDNMPLLMSKWNDNGVAPKLICSPQLEGHLRGLNYAPDTFVENKFRRYPTLYPDSNLSVVAGDEIAYGYLVIPSYGFQNILSLNQFVAMEYRKNDDLEYTTTTMPLFNKLVEMDLILEKGWESSVPQRSKAQKIMYEKAAFALEFGILGRVTPAKVSVVKVSFKKA